MTEIQRDTERTVTKLHVAEGDNVKQGDVLFQYDSEELQLSLDKQNLELEQLKNTSTTPAESDCSSAEGAKNASKDEQLSYTVEIQSKEAQKKENDYNIKVKQREIAQTKTNLANAEILAPVSGRVVSVSEDGYDQYGNPKPYITIQQSGSYRVKGTINELSMGAVTEGMAMRIFSPHRSRANLERYGEPHRPGECYTIQPPIPCILAVWRPVRWAPPANTPSMWS